jgi:hypothetical protein
VATAQISQDRAEERHGLRSCVVEKDDRAGADSGAGVRNVPQHLQDAESAQVGVRSRCSHPVRRPEQRDDSPGAGDFRRARAADFGVQARAVERRQAAVRPGVVADRTETGFGSERAAPPREPLADEEERPARAGAPQRPRDGARVRTGPVVERERDQPRSSVAAVDRYAAAGEAIDGELAGGSRAPAVHKWVRGGGAGRRQREGHGEEQDPHAWDTSPDAEGA